MRRRTPRAASSRSIRPSFEPIEPRILLATFVVTNTNDNTNMGSLRWAITQSNATPGSNIIDFDIASSGVQIIGPMSALPAITVPVTIDGTTEPGYSGTPLIELYGGGAGKGIDGIDISAGNSTVKGLAIDSFTGEGISLSVAGGDTIQDDFIGADPSGTVAGGNGLDGVEILVNSNGNTIEDDLLSGNSQNGIYLNGTPPGGSNASTSGNLIVGNLIGTDITGTKALGNANVGIYVQNAPMTTIGGTVAADRNIISGNATGMELYDDSDDSLIEGNYVGTDVTGTVALGNSHPGGFFNDNVVFMGMSNSTFGGTVAGAGNLVSGGAHFGIDTFGGGSQHVTIQGNLVGTDVTGTKALGNVSGGIVFVWGTSVTIGGTAAGAGNVISGNGGAGINTSTPAALIQGNLIGTDISGTEPLGNHGDGIDDSSTSVTIGGTAAGAGNVISDNTGTGIVTSSTGVIIQGNLIGTDISGIAPLGNGGEGLNITAMDATVGGTAAGAGNVIAYNGISENFLNCGVYLNSPNIPVLDNSIFNNGSEGILLNFNPHQAAPVLTSALTAASGNTFAGSLSGPAGTYTLQFFANDALDPAGYAEGQTLLGTETLTTNGSTTNFSDTLPPELLDGEYITATATSSAGETSDFSTGIVDTSTPPTITAKSSSQSVIAGQPVTDTFTITNPGTIDDAGISFDDPIPAGTTYVSGMTSTGAPVMLTGGAATAAIGGLAAGQSMTVSVVLMTSVIAEPSFTNTGDVTATTPPIAPGVVTASATTTVLAPMPAKPTIGVAASSQLVYAGQQVTDTFTITNPGTGGDAGVAFSDTIPAGTTYVSGTTSIGALVVLSNGIATATIGALAAGQSVTVSIALMTSAASVPSLTNTGSVTATTPVVAAGTDTASITTAVAPSADLAVVVSAPTATTTTTGKLTFTATVSNAGPSSASDVTLIDTFTLLAGAVVSSETASQGTVKLSGGNVIADLGNIALGANATLTVVVTVTSAGTVAQAAVVSSGTNDPNTANNSASDSATVHGVATVAITAASAQVIVDRSVTLNAQVSVPPGFATATKTVTFYDGSTSLGMATLNASGHASMTVTLHTLGTHSFSVDYSGDSNYQAVNSTTTAVKVVNPTYGDYDGDGKTDIAIFDQATSTFAILDSSTGFRIAQLGNTRDVNIPVVGDFDGDGRDDLAVYDQTAAEFLIIYSGGGSLIQPFGDPYHVNIPVAGDFDGSGKTNLAIYDETTATFAILLSNGTIRIQPFGDPSHVNIPVAGDFDGDGKTDIAIFDQTTATFAILDSGGGSLVRQLGNPHDVNVPIAADFDGDGKTDLAVYDQTAGVLLALESGGGTIFRGFGNPADANIPVPGDYNGDGKTDFAVYDPVAGEFLVIFSGDGSEVEPFGDPKHKNIVI